MCRNIVWEPTATAVAELTFPLHEYVLVLSLGHLIPADLLRPVRLQPEPPVCILPEILLRLFIVALLGQPRAVQHAVPAAAGSCLLGTVAAGVDLREFGTGVLVHGGDDSLEAIPVVGTVRLAGAVAVPSVTVLPSHAVACAGAARSTPKSNSEPVQ